MSSLEERPHYRQDSWYVECERYVETIINVGNIVVVVQVNLLMSVTICMCQKSR